MPIKINSELLCYLLLLNSMAKECRMIISWVGANTAGKERSVTCITSGIAEYYDTLGKAIVTTFIKSYFHFMEFL